MARHTKIYLVALVLLLMLVSGINVADKELLDPMANAVKAELSLSDTRWGLIRSAVFLAALLGNAVWGLVSDRWIRKYVIVIGTVLWSGITWITSFVGGFYQLLAARASMSLAEGCFDPSAYPLITDSVPRKRHGLVLGLLSMTYPIGTATALVVAAIIGTAHWRQPFVVFGIVGLVLGLLVLVIVKEPKRGATEFSVEESAGTYGGKFSFKELKRIISIPSTLLVFALNTCQAAVNWSLAYWAPLYLTRYKIAPNAEAASLALLPAIVGFVAGSFSGGIVIDRLRRRTPSAPVWVALFAMTGGLILSVAAFNVYALTPFMVTAFFLGFVAYTVMPAVTTIMYSVVSPETKASSMATSNIILNLVIAALSFLIGYFSDLTHQLRYAFGGAVILMFSLGVVASVILLRTFPKDMERRQKLIAERTVSA